eukprot:403376769
MQAIKQSKSKLLNLLRPAFNQQQFLRQQFRTFSLGGINKFGPSLILNQEMQTQNVSEQDPEHQTQDQLQQKMQDYQQQSQVARPKKTRIEHMCKGAFPLDKAGTHLLPKLPNRQLCDNLLSKKNLTEELLRDHFSGMFLNFVEQLANKNYEAVQKMTEKRLFEKLSSQKENLEKFKLEFDVNKIEGDESYIVDQILVKGVSQDRELNDQNIDYIYSNRYEGEGLRIYTHKYFIGYAPLYLQQHNEEEMKAIEEEYNSQGITPVDIARLQDRAKDIQYGQRKRLLERAQNIVFRITFQFKGQNKALKALSGPESLYDPNYSGNHIVIFENQLSTPSTMNLIDYTVAEYIMMRKLNFKNWKIVDVDHYMKGNSFFKSVVPDNQFFKNINQYLGTPEKRIADMSNEETAQGMERDIKQFLSFISKKEPKSNRGLEVFLSQEEIDSANKLLEEQNLDANSKKDKKEGEKVVTQEAAKDIKEEDQKEKKAQSQKLKVEGDQQKPSEVKKEEKK